MSGDPQSAIKVISSDMLSDVQIGTLAGCIDDTTAFQILEISKILGICNGSWKQYSCELRTMPYNILTEKFEALCYQHKRLNVVQTGCAGLGGIAILKSKSVHELVIEMDSDASFRAHITYLLIKW